MNPTVLQQLLKRPAGDFTPHRIEAGDGNDLRRVIDDQVDAGLLFERANIATFTADNAALHVVGRQWHDRNRCFSHVIGGDALHGGSENLARPPIGFLTNFLLDFEHSSRGHGPGFNFDSEHQFGFRFVGGQAGHPFEFSLALFAGDFDFLKLPGFVGLPAILRLLDPEFFFANLAFTRFDSLALLIDRFFFLFDSAFDSFSFFPALGQLPVDFSPETNCFVFRFDRGIAPETLCFFPNPICFLLCCSNMRIGTSIEIQVGQNEGESTDEHRDQQVQKYAVHRVAPYHPQSEGVSVVKVFEDRDMNAPCGAPPVPSPRGIVVRFSNLVKTVTTLYVMFAA